MIVLTNFHELHYTNGDIIRVHLIPARSTYNVYVHVV